MNFILTQTIGGIGYAILGYSYFKKQKKKILFLQIISYILFAIHYFMLSGITGAVCNIIGLIALVSIFLSEKYNFKYKNILVLITIVLLLIVNLFTYNNIFSIFPIISSVVVIISFLTNDEDIIRGVGVIAAICWLIYAVVYKSYVAIVFEIITLIATYIAFMKNYKFVSIRIKYMAAIVTGMLFLVASTMGFTYKYFSSGLLPMTWPNYIWAVLPRVAVSFFLMIIGVLFFIDYCIISPINNITRVTKEFAYDTNNNRKENVEKIFKLKYHKRNDELGKLYSAIAMTTRESVEFNEDIQLQADTIAKMQDGLIMVLSEMVESRDKGTGNHIKKTKAYVEIIINEMKKEKIYENQLTEKFIENTIKAAPLHDIGKIHVPDSILIKPARLTDEEFEIMKTHTTYGAKMLQYTIEQMTKDIDIGYLTEAKNVAEFHHEKWNGQGYPKGLSGEEIPLSARIMAVADVFDALVSKRSYKEPFSFEEAIEIITNDTGTHFDPLVVKAFLNKKDDIKNIAIEIENRYQYE